MDNPTEILARSLHRDAAMRTAGNSPKPFMDAQLLKFIGKHNLYASEEARRWLIERSSTQDSWVASGIAESIWPLVEQGYADDAVTLFSSLLGLDDNEHDRAKSRQVLGRYSPLQHQLRIVLDKPGLVATSALAWGKVLIRLQSILLDEEYERATERWERGPSQPHFANEIMAASSVTGSTSRVLPHMSSGV